MNLREELRAIIFKNAQSIAEKGFVSEQVINDIFSLFAPRPIDDEAKSGKKIIGFFPYDMYCCPCALVKGKWFSVSDEEPCLEFDMDPVFYIPFPEKLEPQPIDDEAKNGEMIVGYWKGVDGKTYSAQCLWIDGHFRASPLTKDTDCVTTRRVRPTHYIPMPEKLEEPK